MCCKLQLLHNLIGSMTQCVILVDKDDMKKKRLKTIDLQINNKYTNGIW